MSLRKDLEEIKQHLEKLINENEKLKKENRLLKQEKKDLQATVKERDKKLEEINNKHLTLYASKITENRYEREELNAWIDEMIKEIDHSLKLLNSQDTGSKDGIG